MKASQKKAILTVIIAAAVVIASIAVFTKYGTYDQSVPQDPLASRKAKILALAYSDSAVTTNVKQTVMEYVSGPAMLEYNFTHEEKIRIIKFLNK